MASSSVSSLRPGCPGLGHCPACSFRSRHPLLPLRTENQRAAHSREHSHTSLPRPGVQKIEAATCGRVQDLCPPEGHHGVCLTLTLPGQCALAPSPHLCLPSVWGRRSSFCSTVFFLPFFPAGCLNQTSNQQPLGATKIPLDRRTQKTHCGLHTSLPPAAAGDQPVPARRP